MYNQTQFQCHLTSKVNEIVVFLTSVKWFFIMQ